MTLRSYVQIIWQLGAMILYFLNLLSLIDQLMILSRLRTMISLSTNMTVLHWSRRISSRSSSTSLEIPRLKASYSSTVPIILPPHIVSQVRSKIRMAVSLILIQQMHWMWKYPSSNGASLIPPLGIWSSVTSLIKQNEEGQIRRRQSEISASWLGTPTAIQESSTTRIAWNSLWITETWPWCWRSPES